MIHNSKIPYQLSKIRLHIRNELNYCGDMLVLFGLLEHKLRVTLSSFRKIMIKYGLQYIYSRMEKGILLNHEIYNYLI